jgi:hypothetical protein
MFQTKFVEKIKTHFMFNNVFVENLVLYKTKWKNTVDLDRPQMTMWCMRIACWILKATDTNSEYVILISLTLQQWLHERASMLRYMYIAYLVKTNIDITYI